MIAESLLFWIFATLSGGAALAAVLTQNIVRMAFWLVVSLGSVAALFFLLQADFLAAAQLLIYVGGTVVILIFGVMLTATGPETKPGTLHRDLPLALGVSIPLFSVMLFTVASVDWNEVAARHPSLKAARNLEAQTPASRERHASVEAGRTGPPLGVNLLGFRVQDANAPAARPLTGYLLPFEIISVHLLVVLVGAAYLARAKRRVGSPVPGGRR